MAIQRTKVVPDFGVDEFQPIRHRLRAGSLNAPAQLGREAYPNLISFNQVDEGNHVAAWQEPEIFTTELRAGFKSLRRSS